MPRKVSVALEADPSRFVSGIEPAKRTGKEFENQLQRLDVVIRKLPDVHIDAEVGPAERKLAELRNELASLTDERVGVSIGGREALAQIERIKLELKALAATSTNMQVKFDSNAALVELEKLTAKVTPAAKTSGEKIGRKMSEGIADGIRKQTARPEQFQFLSAGVLGPAIAAAAPTIAAGIAAAVTTGVGLGFVGVGAIALHGRADIKAAFASLATDVGSVFTSAAQPLAGPFVSALRDIDATVKSLGPGLRSTFAALVPAIGPLAAGLGGFARDVLPGLESAAKASVPLLTQVGKELPGFGAALGTLIKDLGDAPGAIHFVEVGFKALDGTLRVLGATFKFLSTLYEGAYQFWRGFGVVIGNVDRGVDTLTSHLGGLAGKFHPFGTVAGKVANAVDLYAQAANAAGVATQTFGTAAEVAAQIFGELQTRMTTLKPSMDLVAQAMTDKIISTFMNLDRANIAVAASLDNVTKTLKNNKKSLDITTDAGRANRSAVLDAVAANVQLYDAQIQSNISAKDAAAAYDSNTRALERQLLKLGYTKAQVQDLIGKYRNVPHNVNTVLAMQGLTDAIDSLNTLLRIINHIPRQKVVQVTYVQQTIGQAPSSGTGHRAAGGPVSAGMPYVVGEYQPELFVPSVSGTIVPSVPSFDYGSRSGSYTPGQYGSVMAGGGGGGGATTINLNATFVSPSGEVLHKQLVRYALDTNRMPSQLFPASSR